MSYLKYAPYILLAGVIVWFLAYDPMGRVKVAEGRVQILTEQRQQSEKKARLDSMALDSVRTHATLLESQNEAERLQARQAVTRASRQASAASGRLRTVLDSLGAPTAPLDSLLTAHASELAAKDREIVLADSTTAVVRSLLEATEVALASERQAHQSLRIENAALRQQVQALNRQIRNSKLQRATLLLAVAGILILR